MTFPFPVFPVRFASPPAPAPSTAAFHDTAVSTASTVTWPSGIQNGDLAVLLDFATGVAAAPATVTPSGFTLIGTSQAVKFHRANASYKKCDGTETGSLTGMNGNSANRKLLLIIRPSTGAAATWTPGTPSQQATTANPSAQTVTVASETVPVVVCGFYCASGTVTARIGTPTMTTFNSTLLAYMAYRIDNTSPQDTTIDMDDDGDNILQSVFFRLT